MMARRNTLMCLLAIGATALAGFALATADAERLVDVAMGLRLRRPARGPLRLPAGGQHQPGRARSRSLQEVASPDAHDLVRGEPIDEARTWRFLQAGMEHSRCTRSGPDAQQRRRAMASSAKRFRESFPNSGDESKLPEQETGIDAELRHSDFIAEI